MPNDISREQDLMGRLIGAEYAASAALDALAICYGVEARTRFEMLRKELLDEFKNSEISAEREMEHATVATPVIETINHIVDRAIDRMGDTD